MTAATSASTSGVIQVLTVVLTAISTLLAVVSASGATGDLGQRIQRLAGKLGWTIYLWPALAIGPLAIAIFVWSPTSASFPSLEFYRVAAEVIPLLLLALLVERSLIERLKWGVRLEFLAMLLVAEIAAFIGVSEIFGQAPDVGGTAGWTGLLAGITGAGLLAGAGLVSVAAVTRP